MRFTVDQAIGADPAEVAAAYVDPEWYEAMVGLPRLGAPEVLDIEVDGSSTLTRVRYRFTGEVSSAVRAAVDVDRLTWVEVSRHRLSAGTTTFELVPDHYAGRFTCRGSTSVRPSGRSTTRSISGDLRVRMPLVGGQVERAIVSGLREHLEAEAGLLTSWLDG